MSIEMNIESLKNQSKEGRKRKLSSSSDNEKSKNSKKRHVEMSDSINEDAGLKKRKEKVKKEAEVEIMENKTELDKKAAKAERRLLKKIKKAEKQRENNASQKEMVDDEILKEEVSDKTEPKIKSKKSKKNKKEKIEKVGTSDDIKETVNEDSNSKEEKKAKKKKRELVKTELTEKPQDDTLNTNEMMDDKKENKEKLKKPKKDKNETAKKDNIKVETADDKKVTLKKTYKTKEEIKLAKVEKKKMINKELIEKAQENIIGINEMFEDTPTIESESLKKEIQDRITTRNKKTVVLTNMPNIFSVKDVKELIPNMVSCIIHFNQYYHTNTGIIMVDLPTPEEAASVIQNLNDKEIKSRKIKTAPLTADTVDVDKYNCQRLVIGNIRNKTTTEDLKKVLTKVHVEMLPIKGIAKRGHRTAFAQYACVEDAIADYDTKHGVEINECPINIKFQMKNSERKSKKPYYDRKKLTISGITINTTMTQLKNAFPQSLSIKRDLNKKTAHCEYSNEAQCVMDRSEALKNNQEKWRINFDTNALTGEQRTKGKRIENKKVKGDKIKNEKMII